MWGSEYSNRERWTEPDAGAAAGYLTWMCLSLAHLTSHPVYTWDCGRKPGNSGKTREHLGRTRNSAEHDHLFRPWFISSCEETALTLKNQALQKSQRLLFICICIKKKLKRVLLHHQRLDLIALKWKENVLFLMDYNNLQTWRTFILLLWHTVCVCGRGLHTQTQTDSNISEGLQRTGSPAHETPARVVCQEMSHWWQGIWLTGVHWLCVYICVYTNTHTAHWACCYYANKVITHALSIRQTPPLLVLIRQHDPRLRNA